LEDVVNYPVVISYWRGDVATEGRNMEQTKKKRKSKSLIAIINRREVVAVLQACAKGPARLKVIQIACLRL